jgi:hypothetical protein
MSISEKGDFSIFLKKIGFFFASNVDLGKLNGSFRNRNRGAGVSSVKWQERITE